jgi:hypothetical protein
MNEIDKLCERYRCSHPGVEDWYDIRACDFPAFRAAIEKAAREEAIRECMEERDRVKRDSFLVLAATVLAAGGRIAVDRDSMLKSIDTNLERVDNPDGTFEFRALLKEGS